MKKASNLLFVSDAGTGDVYLYKLPSLTIAARVTGFTQPQGECSDGRGDVWVTDTNARAIYELSHAGRLENTLTDADGYPVGCAWDASTGSLAVMNLFGVVSTPGNVLVYPYGSGTPVEFTNPAANLYYFGDYDGKGDLFFDGLGLDGKFILSELTKNFGVQTIGIKGGTIYYPGMVQWAGSYLDVGDQSCGNANASCIYRLSVASKTGTIAGQVGLNDADGKQACDVVQGVVIGTRQVGGSDNDFCGHEPSATYLWKYPAGGNPAAKNDDADSLPVGAALSASQRPAPTRVAAPPSARKRSWMDPNVANADLLYISDGNGEVTVYRYWRRTLVGILTNFTRPLGMCADKSGDVFIADYGAKEILGYSHSATKPFRKISTAPYGPYDCAVDPVSGDLAVANADGGSSGEGNVAIYPNASGTPAYRTDANIFNFQSCVYDDNGNLLVTNGNLTKSGSASFAWLPKGGNALVDLNVPGPQQHYNWREVQGLAWDGEYFALEDYDSIYRVALLKGQAFYVGGSYFDIDRPALYAIYNNGSTQQGKQVVGAYDNSNYGGVEYFNYPAGGDAIHYISHGIDAPYGLAVSLKKKRK
ncbi:MAG TPA: hypothetical protein VN909_08355 [Candidatus Dormibacteraeota bacterium]|nr:hypothetical protein [Candidatus Dormibacteraeota bacterium]